ncbi:MAG: hypothetical protein MUP13_09765 [Thermoanaerobaculales bacterium]|nr:hypothetical protein [Thermoanaerobaculales bacterium]
MKPARFFAITALFLVALPLFADEPGREFSAEAVVNNRDGKDRMLVSFIINRYSSVEELQNLAGVLENGGQFGLLSVLKGRRDGRLQMGVIDMPIALVVVEEQGRDYRYLLLTPRRIGVDEEMLGKDSLDYPFGIAVFEVDRFGRGEGRLHVSAALRIDADGHVEIDDYDGVDGTIERIKQVR